MNEKKEQNKKMANLYLKVFLRYSLLLVTCFCFIHVYLLNVLPSNDEDFAQFSLTFDRPERNHINDTIKTILIGVTASRKTFPDHVRKVEKTWAKNPPSNVVIRYFVGEATEEKYVSGSSKDIRSLAEQAGITDLARIIVMNGVKDDEYPLGTKASQVLKHLEKIVRKSERFIDWIMDVDDDTFVHMDGMVKFLTARNEHHHQYIGQRVPGLKKPYCNGGAGFALSRSTLKVLAKTIDSCQQSIQAAVLDQERVYDVLIGICVYNEIGIGCWDGEDYNKHQFYNIFSEEHDDKDLLHAVTSRAFKHKDDMVNVNQRNSTLLRTVDNNNNIKGEKKKRKNKNNTRNRHALSLKENTIKHWTSRLEHNDSSSLVLPIENIDPFAILKQVNAYVTTLANSLDDHKIRMNVFSQRWKGIPLQYQINDALLRKSPDLGFSKSLLNAVKKAMNDGTKDFYLFLEDDAVPFSSQSPLEFAQQLTETIAIWPQISPYLLIGGHSVCHLETPNTGQTGLGGVTRIQMALGSFALLMRSSFLKRFHGLLLDHIKNFNGITYSPDAFLFRQNYFDDSLPAYIATPLIVDHLPGYSSTMESSRDENWMGKSQWWKMKLDDEKCSREPYKKPGCDVACARSSVHQKITIIT